MIPKSVGNVSQLAEIERSFPEWKGNMGGRTMKQLALSVVVCGCFFCLWAVTAQASLSGIHVQDHFSAENAEEPHPKKLQTSLAVTQEMVDSQGVAHPLFFGFRYANGVLEEDKTKVIFQVRIYRGEELLWKAKRKRKPDEYGDHRYVHCKTYDEGLLPGDLLVFTYKFKKAPRAGEVGLIRLAAMVSPREMWEEDPWGLWPLGDEFSDCRWSP